MSRGAESGAGCPEPWVLEGFVQGSLETGLRQRVEEHMDRCPDCGQTIAELARLFGTGEAALQSTLALDDDLRRPPEPETLMGRYQLGRRLGSGAMGVVFEAHDPELHRRVAVKLLHLAQDADPDETRSRLLREARAMAQLAHPNVVAVHDVGRVGEQVFVAMELVEGTTLTQWLGQEHRSRDAIVEMFVQAGRGLEAAHAVGLVHRDFKPDNVLIGRDARARVTDFGLARPFVSYASQQEAPTTSLRRTGVFHDLTARGAIVGTPAYMAPEQWRGRPADARSDQFSFCVALCEALTSHRPFAGEDITSLADAVVHGRRSPLPRNLPRWLRSALVRGLATDPERRHDSMSALLSVLGRDRGSAKRWAAIGGAMVLGAAATVGILQWASAETVPLSSDAASKVDVIEPTAAEPGPSDADPEAARTACLKRVREIDGTWDAKRHERLRERVLGMDGGAELAPRVVATLDGWAERYAAAAEPLCETKVPLPHRDARRRCLRDAAERLNALLLLVEQRETFVTRPALLGAAHRLPEPNRCSEPRWLEALGPAPTGERRASARLLRADLAAAQAAADLYLLNEAPGDAEHVVHNATELGEGPLLAEAQLALGRIAAARRQADFAVQWLSEAVVKAEASNDPRVRGEAVIELLLQEGAHRLRVAEAKRWQRLARAHADRMQDPELQTEALLAEARFLQATLELREAQELLASTAALPEASSPRLRARVHRVRSEVLHDLGDAAGALEEARSAVSILQETVGPRDLELGGALLALARAHLLAGELDEAEDAAETAEDLPVTSSSLRHDLDRGDALEVLGDIQAAAGRTDDALASYEKAAIYHYTGPWKAEPLMREGALRVRMNDVDAGLTRLQAALDELKTHYDDDDPRLLPALRALGRAQHEAGRLDSARTTLSSALELVDASVGYGPLLARSQIDLARLERDAGNEERALELFDDAHVPWVGAYGMEHPRVVEELLARADLAWALGQHEYARRLYRSTHERFVEQYGPNHEASRRAAARAGLE